MKVAQYEVLGNNAKRDVRPVRDDRSVLAPGPLLCGFTSEQPSIVPSGTGRFFNATPALRTGLLSLRPSGTVPGVPGVLGAPARSQLSRVE